MPQIPAEERPEITDIATGAALRRWYWTRNELSNCAAHHGLRKSGAKFDILDTIAQLLDTGQTAPKKAPKATSRFDWHSETLTADTVITDNYRNTQNVRRFFQTAVGPEFKFTIGLMDWIKSNVGRPLGDAAAAHTALMGDAKRGVKSQIKSHNQFNQYTRDFLKDNPDLGMDDVRRIWAKKRRLPTDTGRHVYHRDDLRL